MILRERERERARERELESEDIEESGSAKVEWCQNNMDSHRKLKGFLNRERVGESERRVLDWGKGDRNENWTREDEN